MNKPYRRICKDVRFYCIPIRQPDDLRCVVFKIEPNFAPFAVVVRLILVDSGGYFLFFLRLSVCFSVTVWITPLSSSFSRSLSNVRR